MSNDGDYLRRTVTSEPVVTRREEVYVTRGANTAGWWIAALVAVIAIVGVIFLISNNNTQAQLQAARDQGAAQAGLENATTNAQIAASQASARPRPPRPAPPAPTKAPPRPPPTARR